MLAPARPGGVPRSRAEAEEADRLDPLAGFRDEFVIPAPAPIYLDGNSLGRPPRAVAVAVGNFLAEWGGALVTGWERWAELPNTIGDRIGSMVGAAAGQIAVSDSTTVNLYKLAEAALAARPGRGTILADQHDFPTLNYVLQGVAARHGLCLRLLATDPNEGAETAQVRDGLDDDVALVCLSAVNFRSGAVADMALVNTAAHQAGALTLWDLSHAAGVLPVELDASGADLAAGCTYKYLNGGPGAPAWLYVRSSLQTELRQPVWGWWGQRDQFAMRPGYDPVESIGRFLTGTPAVLGLVALDAALGPSITAGVEAIWQKARRLVELLAVRALELAPDGAKLASPAEPRRRGGHLALAHPNARNAAQLLIERGLVVPDYRPPDVLRLAPAALYTSYTDVWDAMDHLGAVLADPAPAGAVPGTRFT
ncbi:MAG TPA: aminotransferase class V-fold PLP-dependent enzyme [Acidimicrobiales bacterium]|nr:aminotransferase class V-fold PLP-dependent enzyme [Acidimicrobiales bacterium]